MTTMELDTQVKSILTERLGLPAEAITSDARLVEDLEMDSLDAVELAIQMEREFGISIEEDALRDVGTVAEVVALLERLRSEQGVTV
ncbi:MAG: acyl carrier protein [Candidatus Rokubacteria bacterium]|nr:acyl carrier protein [Candidatus Rokubacteria bacterium]